MQESVDLKPSNHSFQTPIVTFKPSRIKKRSSLSSLVFLAIALSIAVKYIESESAALVLAIFAFIFFFVGFWAWFGFKVYDKIGVLEFDESYIKAIYTGSSIQYKWSDLENVSLAYLLNRENRRQSKNQQISRCFITFEHNSKKYLFDYLLLDTNTAYLMSHFVRFLNKHYPEINTINTFGKEGAKEIELLRTSSNST